MHKKIQTGILVVLLSIFSACGDKAEKVDEAEVKLDPKYSIEYKGLSLYAPPMSMDKYTLSPLNDEGFNVLSSADKLLVADKLLTTLFFNYPYEILQEKIDSGTFISDVYRGLSEDVTDKAWLESYILDETYFTQNSTNQEATDILTRFYAAKNLDKYFFHNWTAYILTQTSMFSPAYALESIHAPNISRVYNRLVTLLDEENSMAYITYIHMMSEDNWRRFRSPEDNGREMLEIFLADKDDAKVPLAGKALQNWRLNRDNDTLVIGLNENREALSLFNTSVYNGDDFYRELVKSSGFTPTVIAKLVGFFFTDNSKESQASLTQRILSSNPKSFQAILKQIVFSQEYLLHTTRAKSAEESFFALTKKLSFKHSNSLLYYLRSNLEKMHQASMKYKLGKLQRVPLDTLSFANYHKSFRETILLRHSNPEYEDIYTSYYRQGWSDDFADNRHFNYDAQDSVSLNSLISYLFKAVVSRDVRAEELAMFRAHMLKDKNEIKILSSDFDMYRDDEYWDDRKRNIIFTVMEYLSRVDDIYTFKEVK